MTNPRIASYFKILRFFEKNPFEVEYCGLSKHNAFCLIQSYLQSVSSRLKNQPAGPENQRIINSIANINLLQFSDLVSSGKKIQEALRNHDNQITAAIAILGNFTEELPTAPTTQLPQNMPSEIKQLVEIYEKETLKTGERWQENWRRRKTWEKQKHKQIDERRKDNGQTEEVAYYLNGREWVSNTLAQMRNEELRQARARERLEKQTTAKLKLAGQVAVKITGQPDSQLHKDIADAIDFPIVNEKGDDREVDFWESLSIDPDKPTFKQDVARFNDERAEEIKKIYQEKLFSKTSLTIDRTKIEETINSLPAASLLEISYHKYLNRVNSLTDVGERREKLGRLLFGKLLVETELACQALPTDSETAEKKAQAIFETYFDLQQRGHSLLEKPDAGVNQLLFENLQKKFKDKPIIPNPNLNILSEAQELAAIDQHQQVTHHTLPIPGLIFLNSFSKNEIIASDAVFKTLLSGSVSQVFENVRLQKINELELELKHAVLPWSKNKLQQQIASYKQNSGEQVFQQIMFLEPTKGHNMSPEEMAVLRKYLESYQKLLQKAPFFGKIAHWSAMFHSMDRKILGVPLAYWGGYGKAFLSAAIGDPTIAPYALGVFVTAYAKGRVGLAIKGSLNKWIGVKFNSVLAKVTGKRLANFLTGLVVFQEGGMVIIPFLSPRHAIEALVNKYAKKTAQELATRSALWLARALGKEAVIKTLETFGFAGLATIPVVGPVIAIIGTAITIVGIVWDFLIPQKVKQLIYAAVAGLIYLVFHLLSLLWGVLVYLLGPLGAIGFMLPILLFGPIVGLPMALVLGTVGASIGTTLFGLFGWHTAPGWVMSFAPGWTGITGFIQNLFSVPGAAAAPGAAGVGGAAGGTGGISATTGGLIPVVTVAGAGVASYLGITFLTTTMWTPVSPMMTNLGSATGAAYSTKIKVEKTATLPAGCNQTTKKCEKIIIDEKRGINYEITITVDPSITIDNPLRNIIIEDKLTLIARDPNNSKKTNKYTIQLPGATGDVFTETINALPFKDPADGQIKNSAKLNFNNIIFDKQEYFNGLVTNSVTAVSGSEKAFGSYSFAIGDPPARQCPVLDAGISCGSLGGIVGTHDNCQHGTVSYWSGDTACSYAIPYLDRTIKYGRVQYGSYSGPEEVYKKNACFQEGASIYYGFAADLVPQTGAWEIVFPAVNGDFISWERDGVVWKNGEFGWSSSYTGTGTEGSYRMFITHLTEESLNKVSKGVSGEILGSVYLTNPQGAHLHYEVSKITGSGEEFLRPDMQCQ